MTAPSLDARTIRRASSSVGPGLVRREQPDRAPLSREIKGAPLDYDRGAGGGEIAADWLCMEAQRQRHFSSSPSGGGLLQPESSDSGGAGAAAGAASCGFG